MTQSLSDRKSTFKNNAELTTATVEFVTNDQQEISKALQNQTNNEKNVLISVKEEQLIQSYINSINPIYIPTKEEIVTIPYSITDSICGVSETGSVIISLDTDYGAYYSMLSCNHIVLLHANDIYERPRDVFDDKRLNEANPNFSFITGPSATADMGSLVRGVHGPEKLHIIVIG